MLQYHHCMSLERVIFGEVKPNPEQADSDFKGAYSWLEKQVGFYPLFLAVGQSEEDVRMTGYQNQWRKLLVISKKGNEYVQKGQFPNDVLFSFMDVDGVFMDYDYWHLVLNASHKDYQMTDYEKRLVLKPSWPKSKWLRKARKNSHSVQLVVPSLFLPRAKRIWVRNQKTRKLVETIGFENVEVRRVLLEEPDHI